ncbi:MAG: YggS family pyridoxal phosphate-dependent enzyme [Desulfovibrionaceae bacterium]|nr:YggS family pyridoxal phosphate-dependent enzyme [Desulfovibrionaceae bacterium]
MNRQQELHERWQSVKERLASAVAASGRHPSEITLVAVSKLHEAADIATLAALGQVDFGENYVQEACAKQQDLLLNPACQQVRWHFIGHVQSRKAAQVGGAFALVHTVDSAKLAQALEKQCLAVNKRQPVLIQVNIGAEEQKSGVMAAALPALAEQVLACPHLDLQGLMCLPPVFDNGALARPYFAQLRALRDDLSTRLAMPLPHLSMGMSGDFAEAVLEGATLVRIGTDIFGARPPKKL